MRSHQICDGPLHQIRMTAPAGSQGVPGRSPEDPQGCRRKSPHCPQDTLGTRGGPEALRRKHVEYQNTCMVPQGTQAYKGHRQCQLAHHGIEVKRCVTAQWGLERPKAVDMGGPRGPWQTTGRQCVLRGAPGDHQSLGGPQDDPLGSPGAKGSQK